MSSFEQLKEFIDFQREQEKEDEFACDDDISVLIRLLNDLDVWRFMNEHTIKKTKGGKNENAKGKTNTNARAKS